MLLRNHSPKPGRAIALASLMALLLAGTALAEPVTPAPETTKAEPLPLNVQPSAEAPAAEPAPEPADPVQAAPKEPAPKPAVPKQAAPKPAAPKRAATTAPVSAPAPQKPREPAPLVYAKMSEDPAPTLTPSTFVETLRMAEHYKALAEAGGWRQVPVGLNLKQGDRDPAVIAMRGHLVMTGDLAADAEHSDLYDAPMVAAVKSFQQRHGLPESGLVQRLTVAALNVPASVRHRQLASSAERLMGSRFPFGSRYVTVNIPSATVEAVESGSVSRRFVAVVGKPETATPTVETRITDVNLNPTWTVPVSLIKNEIIPTMRRDPGYLAKNHIRILGPGGVEVDPTTIDWTTQKAVNYTLRQDSGFGNSLGQVRIDMPNKHAVYMHDTPSKSLFAGNVRFHSHGCVRVGQVKEFAAWLLQGTEGPNGPGSKWGAIEIESGIALGERRDIKLVKQIPVTFVYLTGYATADGRAHFRDDIYGLDDPTARQPVAPAPAVPTAAADVTATGAIAARPAPKPARPVAPAAFREQRLVPPGLVGGRI